MRSATKIGLIGLAAVSAAALPSIASAAVVIVRSVGPSAKLNPPGKALPDSTNIKLESGDAVTILGPSGARTLRGPGVFAAGAINREGLQMAAGRRARFGALRTGEVAKNPSVWDLDVTQSGTVCVADPKKLKLWRPQYADAAKVTIRSAGGAVQSADWAAGKATTAWPAGLPVSNGAEYQIEVAGAAEKSSVRIVQVPNAPSDIVGAAKVLIDNGCQNQLDVLVDSASKVGERG